MKVEVAVLGSSSLTVLNIVSVDRERSNTELELRKYIMGVYNFNDDDVLKFCFLGVFQWWKNMRICWANTRRTNSRYVLGS